MCTTTILGTLKVAFNRGSGYSEGEHKNLVLILDWWGSGWPLLTGGRWHKFGYISQSFKNIYCGLTVEVEKNSTSAIQI
jgi:hypothetical protein